MNSSRSIASFVLCSFLWPALAPLNRVPAQTSLPDYKNTSLPIDQRVDDLVSRMTLEEKVGQMMNDAPAIERLGVPSYE